MLPDKYYGDRATNYDRDRQDTPYWRREQEAVKALVTNGPVLDAPVGTGRFGSIYNEKGLEWVGMDISKDMIAESLKKFPGSNMRIGSILDMPFKDDEFATVVCNRLLYFFTPDEMIKATKELCRVAVTPIIAIRTGQEGIPKNLATYTHDEKKFLNAVGDRLIEDSRVTSKNNIDTQTMYKFRKFNHQTDFVDQFQWHQGGLGRAQELAQKWFDMLGITPFDVLDGYTHIEYWNNEDISEVLDDMAAACDRAGVQHDLITEDLPNFPSKLPPIIMCEGGKYAMLDGRRRTNQLPKKGVSPVIIVEDF